MKTISVTFLASTGPGVWDYEVMAGGAIEEIVEAEREPVDRSTLLDDWGDLVALSAFADLGDTAVEIVEVERFIVSLAVADLTRTAFHRGGHADLDADGVVGALDEHNPRRLVGWFALHGYTEGVDPQTAVAQHLATATAAPDPTNDALSWFVADEFGFESPRVSVYAETADGAAALNVVQGRTGLWAFGLSSGAGGTFVDMRRIGPTQVRNAFESLLEL